MGGGELFLSPGGKKLRYKDYKVHSALDKRLFKSQLKDCHCNSHINTVLARVFSRNKT